jgi:short-subunit dehydrogenase
MNKVVILTGASQGIGPHIARALSREGARLVLAARSRELLEEVARELRAGGGEVDVVVGDVTDEGARASLVDRARGRFGRIDVLVNNAGLEEIVPFAEQDPATISRIVEINLIGAMRLARLVLPGMLAARQGQIINIASLAGLLGMPYNSVYAGTKAALIAWGTSLAEELDGTGVQISTVCPGLITGSGMFARRRRQAPGILGSVSTEQVVAGVMRAYRTRALLVSVAARPLWPMTLLRALAPRALMWISRRSGVLAFLRSEAVAEAARQRGIIASR